MTIDWAPLRKELAAWRAQDHVLPLWWRDDDAVTDSAALRQLLDLGTDLGTPLHLAVIPEPAQPALVDVLKSYPNTVVLVHGWAHTNHAPEGAKKAEFGHPRATAASQVRAGLDRLHTLLPNHVLPIFVPPWNRIDPSVTETLRGAGYVGVSTYTARVTPAVAGVAQINCHIDPIHWKAGGGLVPADRTLALLVTTLQDRRAGRTDAAEPLGLLTHHLVHDRAIWDFTRALLSELLDGGCTPINLLELKDNLP